MGRRRAGRLLRARRRGGRGRCPAAWRPFPWFCRPSRESCPRFGASDAWNSAANPPAVMLRAEVEIRDHEWDLGHRDRRRQALPEPQATIKGAATIDGLPVPAIDPSIVASALPRRSRFGLWPNHSISMMPFAGGVRTATIFLMRTLGRKGGR